MAQNENKTTAQELYNFIFEACNILRGPVSQDNFKDYITPLLYYKRISDVYDEETEEALELSGGDKEFAATAQILVSDNFPDAFAAEDRVVVCEYILGEMKRVGAML